VVTQGRTRARQLLSLGGWVTAGALAAAVEHPTDRIGQPLDRNVAIERRVVRPVDFAHAAFANQRQHDVGPDARAMTEGHVARIFY
jgi:hypothetical protein